MNTLYSFAPVTHNHPLMYSLSHVWWSCFSFLLAQPRTCNRDICIIWAHSSLFQENACSPIFSCRTLPCSFSYLKFVCGEMDLWSHSRLKDLSALLALAWSAARGEVGTSPAGGGPGLLVKFFPQVVWLGYHRVRGSLYAEVAQCKTEPHSASTSWAGLWGKVPGVLTAFVSNSARASTVDSPKRQVQAFVLSSGL